MLAWKCQRLKHFTLIGYAIDNDNVVAISRLRGSELQTFEISKSCIFGEIEMENGSILTDMGIALEEMFLDEISVNVGVQNWIPVPDAQLHPIIFNVYVEAETAYLDILMSDQAW